MKYYHHLSYTLHMTTPYTITNIYDRTQSIFPNQNIEIITPIGEVIKSPKSIEQLCHDSCQRILNLADDKKISIFWSGGIDSTLILTEFLKYVPNDRITVVMSQNSFKEYPEFYKKYIKDKIQIKPVSFYTDSFYKELISDSVIVTGNLMDTYFGPTNFSSIPEEILRKDIHSFISPLNDNSKDLYLKIAAACPRELENVKDLFWWIDYIFHYQNEQIMMVLNTEQLHLDKNLFYFSSGKDWNDYSVSTPIEHKWEGYDYRNHKMVLKQHLYKYTKDIDYTENKIKVPSLRRYRNILQKANEPMYITNEWQRGWGIINDKI